MPLSLWGQGYPIIKSYRADEYGGGIQIWDINIDNKGMIYFSNNSGISVFNGTEWQHFTNQKHSHIRCLVRTKDGKLYAGGSSDFGYFESNEKGKLKYTSLNNRLIDPGKKFSDIWSMASNDSGVYLAISGGILFYDYSTIRQIYNTKGVVYVFEVYNKVFASIGLDGIYEIKGSQMERISGLQPLKTERYIKLTPFEKQKIFIVGEETGVWIYDYNKRHEDSLHALTKINTVVDKAIKAELISHAFYDSLHQVLYITTAQSVYGIKPDGTLKVVLNYKTGLPDINLICAKTDKIGNLWVGCNNGPAYVHVASPLRIIDARMNLMGNPFNFIITPKYSYFTNISGLFYLETDSLFTPYPKTLKTLIEHPLGAWAMVRNKDEILVSITSSIRKVTNNQLSNPLINFTAYTLECINPSKQILFIGGPENSWLRLETPQGKLIRINEIIGSVTKVILVKENQIVGEVAYQGVFNLIIDPENPENYIFEWIVPGKFIHDTQAIPFRLGNDIYIAYKANFCKLVFNDKGLLDTLYEDRRFASLNTINKPINYIFSNDPENSIFVLLDKGVYRFEFNSGRSLDETSKPYRIIPGGFFVDQYKEYLIIPNTKGICVFNMNQTSPDSVTYNTIISNVISDRDTLFFGFHPLNNNSITIDNPISYKNTNIQFTFSSPYMFYQDSIFYECRLEGYDKEWINLGSKNQKEYTNLPYGEYTFQVRAKNIYQNYSIPATVNFTIETPWFATWLIKFLLVVIGIVIVYIIIKINTLRLKLHNKRLEQIVEQRTLQIEQQLKSIQEQNKKIVEQNQMISEQAKRLKETNAQLLQLSVVAESTENGVIVFNSSLEIQYINNGVVHLLGISGNTTENKDIKAIVTKYFNPIKHQIREVQKEGASISFETLINTTQHERKWIQITLSPIFDEDKTVSQIVAICTDISALKIAEEEISQQQEELIAQSELLESINAELEKANQMMRDSINYAQRIQTSMLPDLTPLKDDVEDSFIFYKPKDIVSGDFYWYKKVHDVHIMVIADCTGHGVPGAFMSMIGQTLLKETIQGHLILEPEIILNELNQSIHTILRQNIRSEEIQDEGIDMTICIYLPSDNLLRIALANHMAYLISEGEISQIEGDIFSIGGQFSSKIDHQFSVQELFVNKGDVLYLFTDGFHDQLGGDKYSKYGTTRFEGLLKRIHRLPSEDQIEILNDEFSIWRGNRKQTDDITLWGIRF